jgi:ADP-ribosylglycohydrolase
MRSITEGCLIGGAIGDALGAPVEFMNIDMIKELHGHQGVSSFVEYPDGMGEFTDDTQMLLFTAEGLVLARDSGQWDNAVDHVYQAYLRWLVTQNADAGRPVPAWAKTGWLTSRREMFRQRGPGNTCLSALSSGGMGTVANPVNNSKGCGTVMRIAPAGLMSESMEQAFSLGVSLSAITHGHEAGYLSGGFLAALINALSWGMPVVEAIKRSRKLLVSWPRNHEVLSAVDSAVDVHNKLQGQELTVAAIENLGGAWVAEEALAIALLCALHYQDDFRKGVLAAVNHSGDCDSTGAIAGNILGVMLGVEAIPQEWRDNLLFRDIVMDTIARM